MANAKQLQLLIAEDSEDTRILIRMHLKGTSYQATFVGHGKEALDAREVQPWDLILMDMEMPVMDGLTATKAIRQLESEKGLPRVPIVALTANAGAEDIQKSWAAGCDGHLRKPISRARLLQEIEEYGRVENLGARSGESQQSGVDVAAALASLIPEYVSNLRGHARRARESYDRAEFAEVARVAHMVKGSAGGYGFGEIGKIFGGIETAAQLGDSPQMGRLLAEGERLIGALG